jgi:TonB family protein
MLPLQGIVATLILWIAPAVAFSEAGSVPIYPNTIEGLKQQIGDVVEANRQGNGPRVELLMQNLLIPDDVHWAVDNLPEKSRTDLIAKYRAISKVFQAGLLAQAIRLNTSPDISVLVTKRQVPSEIPTDTREMMTFAGASQYRMVFSGDGIEPKPLFASFFYYQGSFRFAGQGLFPFWTPNPHGFNGDGKLPKVLYDPDPAYPEEARKNKVGGAVTIALVVGKDGTPHDLVVKKGDPLLTAAAVEAVSRWRFAPAEVDGNPVDFVLSVQVNFSIHK